MNCWVIAHILRKGSLKQNRMKKEKNVTSVEKNVLNSQKAAWTSMCGFQHRLSIAITIHLSFLQQRLIKLLFTHNETGAQR